MNLSRAAKKFRDQMPQEPEAPKRAKAKKKTQTPPAPAPAPEPVPEPVVETVTPVEPTPEPVQPAQVAEPAPAPTAQPKKVRPVKAKRPRFVFVREKTEKRERVSLPPLPPPSKNPLVRMLTKKLALPPKDDTPKGGR